MSLANRWALSLSVCVCVCVTVSECVCVWLFIYDSALQKVNVRAESSLPAGRSVPP